MKNLTVKTHKDWPAIRLSKGDKKRRIRVLRPSLRRLNARMGSLNRIARGLRGELHKTSAGAAATQLEIGKRLLSVKVEQEKIGRYVEGLA